MRGFMLCGPIGNKREDFVVFLDALESVMCDVIKTSKKKDCNEKWERKPSR